MKPLLVVLLSVAFGAVCQALAAEKPQPLSEAKLAEIVKAAPACPGVGALDLKLRLIDFIDCAADKEEHGFMDQGTSKVTQGSAGKYRVTAGGLHAFFAYRFRSAGKDKPIVVAIEYPDDAKRSICFFTHESGLTGRANNDWSLETGVYCGDPLPLSNRMQYHTFIYWPQDEWPAVIVANWNRYGSSGAAARIWVYAIDAPLPKLDVKEPDPANPRRLGHYNSLHFLPTDLHFGYRSPNAIEHMLDYFQYIGVNELSWTVAYNNTWGISCKVPSWDGGDKSDHLDKVLAAMDKRGGMAFVAGFYLGDDFKVGGKPLKGIPDDLRAVLFKGFDEFLENYGKYKSLKGISLGAMYGIGCIEPWAKSGLLAELVAHIKAKKPDLLVETYVGGRNLHEQYFSGPGTGKDKDKTPTTWDVVSGWEASGKPWSQYLGEQALAVWKEWKHDPAELKKAGLTVLEQLQPDDAGVFSYYAQEPRSLVYYDLDRSQARSDAVSSDRAAMWNTHYEGWLGLDPNVNFWYRKLWVAPDFSPPEPLSMAPFANALALRDRVEIIPGSWNNRYFGHEATVRKFAKAFRSLPAVMLEGDSPVDTIAIRWAPITASTACVFAINKIPFASEIEVGSAKHTLPPFGVATIEANVPTGSRTADGFPKIEPKVFGQLNAEYKKFVEGRIAEYKKLCADVKALSAEAVPAAYTKVADDAEKLVAEGKLYAADIALGVGLVNELRLRKTLLAPPELAAPKVDAAPPMKGELDAWPKAAGDVKADTGGFLAGHTYFPNSWTGPADLSVRLRLAHDGKNLYVGAEVFDQTLTTVKVPGGAGKEFTLSDGLSFRLSRQGYMDWKGTSVAPDFTWQITLPIDKAETTGEGRSGFKYTCRRTKTGYVVEGSAPLAELKLQPGESIGFLLMASDVDVPDNLKNSGWAAKQAMLVPHRPTFEYWGDARTCGRLVLGK